MNGNVWEWCNDRINLFDEMECSKLPSNSPERILYYSSYCNLGGSYFSTNQYRIFRSYVLYIEKKSFENILTAGNEQGIRLARTINI